MSDTNLPLDDTGKPFLLSKRAEEVYHPDSKRAMQTVVLPKNTNMHGFAFTGFLWAGMELGGLCFLQEYFINFKNSSFPY